jgi:hypothetical protein
MIRKGEILQEVTRNYDCLLSDHLSWPNDFFGHNTGTP